MGSYVEIRSHSASGMLEHVKAFVNSGESTLPNVPDLDLINAGS